MFQLDLFLSCCALFNFCQSHLIFLAFPLFIAFFLGLENMADPEVREKAVAEAVADSEEEEEAEKPPTPRQASSTASTSPAAGRSKGTKPAKPQQLQSFDKAEYIESVQEVPFERLHLDTEGKFGQVRVLDMEKVKVIYNNLMVRRPAMLDLVTTLSLTG